MEQLVIHGGRPLSGTITVSGAKNAALPIMAATLVVEERCVLHRVPRLTDVETMAEILRHLGMHVDWVGPNSLCIEPHSTDQTMAPAELVRSMRGSICVLGPMLATRRAAGVPLPGGCVIGKRPIDLHVRGLEALGAEFADERELVYGRADGGLHGGVLSMLGPRGTTVTGTANVLMAAVKAAGPTLIRHAAREPEIQDLCGFLNACGARIRGIGTPVLCVEGVSRLAGVEYAVIPDRIEAGTYMAAAAIAGGTITLAGTRSVHLRAIIHALERMNVQIRCQADRVQVSRTEPLRPTDVLTGPYPGLPTDMQPQISALLCMARGRSRVTERVYPDRFTHVRELKRMGARIRPQEAQAVIDGVPTLLGSTVHAADLRAGAALALAGLASEGTTTITGVDQIDRGYQSIEERLERLGAEISRQVVARERRTA